MSLQQWRMQFRQYVKQDHHYKGFLNSNEQWNPSAADYGFITENDGLRRTALNKKEDCQDFLHLLATFLPHGYLTEKIVNTATSFNTAFNIIQEHYGLLPNQETFLDLDSYVNKND